MNRLLSIFDLAAGNLLRRPARSIAVFLPLALALAVSSAMTVVRDGIARDAQASIAGLPDITVQNVTGGRSERISLNMVPFLEAVPGVERVRPRVWGYLPVRLEKGKGDVAYTLVGVPVETSALPAFAAGTIERGRVLRGDSAGEAVVGQAIAAALGIEPGGGIEITDEAGRTRDFHVVGIFATPVQIYAADLILTGIEDARAYFGYGAEEATDLLVDVRPGEDPDRVAERIAGEYPGLRVLSRTSMSELSEEAYGGRAGVFSLFWVTLLLSALLVAFAQASSIQLDLVREIGILRAVGWDIGDVILLKMIESALLGLLGSLTGILLGLSYVALDAPGVKSFFLGWSVVYPEFALPVALEPASLLLLLAIGVLPLLAATAVPAWITGTLPPDEAIRS